MSHHRPSARALVLGLLSLAAGVIQAASAADTPATPHTAEADASRLKTRAVALYDLTALGWITPPSKVPFVWSSDPAVRAACGPERAPAGLGRPEAELMATAQMPVLAIVLEHIGPPVLHRVPLRSDRVRLYLEGPEPVFLQPALLPLDLTVVPGLATAEPILGQTIFFQLTVQLCAEYKLGRAWTGTSDEARLNQAFVRGVPVAPEQAYFRGQAAPVSPSLAPSRWSLDLYQSQPPRWLEEVWGEWASDVPQSPSLTEADIWAARAPRPPLEGTSTLKPLQPLAFQAGGGSVCRPHRLVESLAPSIPPCVTPVPVPSHTLELRLEPSPTRAHATVLTALLDPDPTSNDTGTPLLTQELFTDEKAEDLVGRLPRYLPRFVSTLDPTHSYSLLLIPDWQLVRALKPDGMLTGFTRTETWDGVGTLLRHPERLHLQLVTQDGALTVPDLLSPLRSAGASLPGQFPGLWASAAPVFLPEGDGTQRVGALQHNTAFHSAWASITLAGQLLMTLMLVAGALRLSELWQTPPLERAMYWPGQGRRRQPQDSEPNEDTDEKEEGEPTP